MVYAVAGVTGSLLRRGERIAWGARTYVMGVVNVTPDSFSGDGVEGAQRAAERAGEQRAQGADFIDIGGESTRPGHEPIDEALELGRVIPAVSAVRARLPDAVISIDTYKPAVARAAQAAGADVINSVWGAPDELLDVAAALRMPIVAMHNQVGTAYGKPVIDVVVDSLQACAVRALARGIPRENVILDPGIGFGKTPDQNLEVLRELERLTALGFPTLLGTSRKSTLGKLTGRDAADRVYATTATTALAVRAGIDVVRVHDVAAARDAVAVADAIVRGWRPDGWERST